MSKPTITRLFVGSLAAIAAGCLVGFIVVVAGFAGGAFVMDGPDVTGIQSTPMAAATLVLLLVSLAAVVAGGIAGLVAWIGALLNTALADNKAWFLALLALGVWNFGIVAMLAYVIAGPDGTVVARQRANAMGLSR